MTRRHITRTLGAAPGGLWAPPTCPAAFAFAGDYVVVLDPSEEGEQ